MIRNLHLGKLNARCRIALALVLLLSTAHRLPAPIQEIPENPTPAPQQSAKPKAKRTSKSDSTARESESSARSRLRPTPVPVFTKRFAGTWKGMVATNNLVIGAGSHPATFVINSAENSIQETGPVGTFTHPATVSGNTLSFKTGLFKEISVTMTIVGDGRSAQVNVTDKIWGPCSGEMKKQN